MIDIRGRKVLVTGATGYVAGWLVKLLLEKGAIVHAAVRDPENKIKLKHLRDLSAESPGEIKFFKSDLLEEGSYALAMKECELVYHTASPFNLEVKDPQKALIDPALLGTKNVLNECNKQTSVKRVVLTSSVAAMYTDCIDLHKIKDGVLSESEWNTTSSLSYQPYSYSKTLAEKAAWEIVDGQSRWDMVTINPSFVLGPALNMETATSESTKILKQLGDGTLRIGLPDIGVGIVDVREVAEAHLQAGLRENAAGRYIVSGHNSSFLEMAQSLLPKYGSKYPLPKRSVPKWLLMLIGPLVNKTMTRKYVRNNYGFPWKADNSKSRNELGIAYRPLVETMNDGFQMLIDKKII
jgi:nucleoside-diphosphate-sugar epimerase